MALELFESRPLLKVCAPMVRYSKYSIILLQKYWIIFSEISNTFLGFPFDFLLENMVVIWRTHR